MMQCHSEIRNNANDFCVFCFHTGPHWEYSGVYGEFIMTIVVDIIFSSTATFYPLVLLSRPAITVLDDQAQKNNQPDSSSAPPKSS